MSDELKEVMKKRTKAFALRVMNLLDALPQSQKGRVISYQLMKSASSVGANYRAACRARSKAEFIAKLQIVLEEADESHYWLELIIEGKLAPEERMTELLNEANELTAMINKSLYRLRGSRGVTHHIGSKATSHTHHTARSATGSKATFHTILSHHTIHTGSNATFHTIHTAKR